MLAFQVVYPTLLSETPVGGAVDDLAAVSLLLARRIFSANRDCHAIFFSEVHDGSPSLCEFYYCTFQDTQVLMQLSQDHLRLKHQQLLFITFLLINPAQYHFFSCLGLIIHLGSFLAHLEPSKSPPIELILS